VRARSIDAELIHPPVDDTETSPRLADHRITRPTAAVSEHRATSAVGTLQSNTTRMR
jgi:hypothetical protein